MPDSRLREAPTTFLATLKELGPGLIIAGGIVGSGELIATTATGAEAGFWLLWIIIVGCVIKVFVQLEIGRYVILTGKTTLQGINGLPGLKIKGAHWIAWFWLAMFIASTAQQGGIVAGSEMTRTHALNHSRSWLLSGSQPPGVAAAQKAAVEVLMSEPQHHAKLWENTHYFRKELQSLGFDTGMSTTPIIPVMCGESSVAKAMTNALGKEGVMAGAIVFPMVARDKARIRTQMSSGLSRDDLDEVLRLFEKVGPTLDLI